MHHLKTVLFCLIGSLLIASCSREAILEEKQGQPELQGVHCNHPLFSAVGQGSSCFEGYTGGYWMSTYNTRNRLTWTVGSGCPSNLYNFYGVPVKYALYKKTGSASGWDAYTKMHEFTSMSSPMTYNGSGTNLPNATLCAMLVQEVPTTVYPATLYHLPSDIYKTFYTSPGGTAYNRSDAWIFTTGNGYGNACPAK